MPSSGSELGRMLAGLASSGDPVWAVDTAHRIVLWNQAAEEAFGRPAAAVLGQPCHQVVGGRSNEGIPVCGVLCGPMERIRRGERVRAFELIAPSRCLRGAGLNPLMVLGSRS
jgi:PAS domain-containing protein